VETGGEAAEALGGKTPMTVEEAAAEALAAEGMEEEEKEEEAGEIEADGAAGKARVEATEEVVKAAETVKAEEKEEEEEEEEEEEAAEAEVTVPKTKAPIEEAASKGAGSRKEAESVSETTGVKATSAATRPASVGVEMVCCGQCGGMIPDVDVETGRARRVEGVMLCRDCHIVHLAKTTHAREVTNADLLTELKNITRTMTYEKFSVFNIFGGITQGGVLIALLYTVMGSNPDRGLLLTIALQLMALTFFILGRQ